MRSLKRSQQKVYIAQPLPNEEIIDDEGYGTGVFANVWDEPVELYLNVAPITDTLERQTFGTNVQNVLKATFTPFDVDGYDVVENSAVWIGVEPNGVLTDGDASNPMNHNYIVTQVLSTGNEIVAYFEKLTGASKA